mmetsp:Transcript_18091/g.30886  ORF Transcript_18091/g.30886 Transcript_18091/m.30886 type:complete len:81 (-) Transcript_18091:1486-1728(-)
MLNGIVSDLDDFLAPSQECIKMIVPSQKPKQPEPTTNKGSVMIDNEVEYDIMGMGAGDKGAIEQQARPDLIKLKTDGDSG